MSKLRRTLSLRRKSSYNALSQDRDACKTPTATIATIKEEDFASECPVERTGDAMPQDQKSRKFNFRPGSFTRLGAATSSKRFTRLQSTSTPNQLSKENQPSGEKAEKSQKHVFSGLQTMKSAINSIGQRFKGKQFQKLALQDSPYMVNNAYITPRRSERIKPKGTPSPITLKMYSPFCIETPGMDDSFTNLSKRKATSDFAESPLAKTPRRMIQSAVKKHKRLAKSMSSTDVPTVSGY